MFARIGDAQKHLTSLKNRISKFTENPKLYEGLKGSVDSLEAHIAHVEDICKRNPGTIPTEVSAPFENTLLNVCRTVQDVESALEKPLSSVFEPGASSAMGNVIPKGNQFRRANKFNDKLKAVQSRIDKEITQVAHLIGMLCSSLKVEEIGNTVTSELDGARSTIDEMQSALHKLAGNAQEGYCPSFFDPITSDTIELDFDSKDEGGKPTTPEGLLKQSVLNEVVTAATGAASPACGVLGMAGVGKTVALQGLCRDKEVKEQFPDGIHYMKFGRDATLQTALREIVRILTATKATTEVKKDVRNSISLIEAVDYAAMWFKGTICLYLVDDLWPGQDLRFQDLRRLLQGSPSSKMAISTRSREIARRAGAVVDFEAREPLGSVSVKIFMKYCEKFRVVLRW